MRYRGRKWNNILMLSVIAFIGVLNLPTLIKAYLIEPEPQVESQYPYLLNPNAQLNAMHFSQWSVEWQEDQWVYTSSNLDLLQAEPSPLILAKRWQQLVGTEVEPETYKNLSINLPSPETIEVWYQDVEEPQRVTYYQLPDFWLLKSWQGKWLAVSVEPHYLLPQPSLTPSL